MFKVHLCFIEYITHYNSNLYFRKQVGYKVILVIKQIIKLPMTLRFGSQYEDLASNFDHQEIKNIHLSS